MFWCSRSRAFQGRHSFGPWAAAGDLRRIPRTRLPAERKLDVRPSSSRVSGAKSARGTRRKRQSITLRITTPGTIPHSMNRRVSGLLLLAGLIVIGCIAAGCIDAPQTTTTQPTPLAGENESMNNQTAASAAGSISAGTTGSRSTSTDTSRATRDPRTKTSSSRPTASHQPSRSPMRAPGARPPTRSNRPSTCRRTRPSGEPGLPGLMPP